MVWIPREQKEGDRAPATCSTGTTRWLPTSAGASPTSPTTSTTPRARYTSPTAEVTGTSTGRLSLLFPIHILANSVSFRTDAFLSDIQNLSDILVFLSEFIKKEEENVLDSIRMIFPVNSCIGQVIIRFIEIDEAFKVFQCPCDSRFIVHDFVIEHLSMV